MCLRSALWKCGNIDKLYIRNTGANLENSYGIDRGYLILPTVFYFICFGTMPRGKQHASKNSEEPSIQGQDAPLNLSTFTGQMSLLKTDIFEKIDSVVGTLRTEISSVRGELTTYTNALRATLDSHASLELELELENSAVFNGDSVKDMQTTVNALAGEVTTLKDKCEELESRSR